MDPISLAVGGGLLVFGYVAGLLTRRRRKPDTALANCDCGHSMALHDRADGTCHADVPRQNTYSEKGKYLGTTYVRCACRQYVGPTPVEEYLAPKFLPPA